MEGILWRLLDDAKGDSDSPPSPFTEGVQVAIAILPKITAIMSILGSATIVYLVVGEKSKRKVHHRILLMMSVFDLMSSFWYFMSSWPIPKDTPNVYGAIGNQESCTAQAFFIQFGLAIPFYNASLALNYLLKIKYNWTDQQIRTIEPYIHIISIGIPLATSVAALSLSLFNEATLWCWINSSPAFCEGDECERGRNARVFQWAFFYAELWGLVAFVAVAMTMVYRHVLRSDAKVSKLHVDRKFSRSKAVARQGLLYVVAFYLTWIFGTISRLYQMIAQKSSTALILLHCIFVPMQGFSNFLVFVRPRYIEMREKYPDKTCIYVFRAAITPQQQTRRPHMPTLSRWSSKSLLKRFSSSTFRDAPASSSCSKPPASSNSAPRTMVEREISMATDSNQQQKQQGDVTIV